MQTSRLKLFALKCSHFPLTNRVDTSSYMSAIRFCTMLLCRNEGFMNALLHPEPNETLSKALWMHYFIQKHMKPSVASCLVARGRSGGHSQFMLKSQHSIGERGRVALASRSSSVWTWRHKGSLLTLHWPNESPVGPQSTRQVQWQLAPSAHPR